MKRFSLASLICITVAGGACLSHELQGSLSPKQKWNIRNEQRARRESPDTEYVYYSTWWCSALGTCSVLCGALCTLIALVDPYIPTADRIICGTVGPASLSWGSYLLKHTWRSDAALIINEHGIRSPDHGLTLWEEISELTFVPNETTAYTWLTLHDGTRMFIDGTVLAIRQETLLRKIQRFRKLHWRGAGAFAIEPLHEKI